MYDDRYKWAYTFVLLLVTIFWSVFTVFIVRDALHEPSTIGVIEASGTSVLLGALIAWNGNVNQYYFRKKPNEIDPASGLELTRVKKKKT